MRLVRLPDGRVADFEPMAGGRNPLVLTPEGVWIEDGEIPVSYAIDAIPLSKDEISVLLILDTKKCPSCIEIINKDAATCRYCGADLKSNPLAKKNTVDKGIKIFYLETPMEYIWVKAHNEAEAKKWLSDKIKIKPEFFRSVSLGLVTQSMRAKGWSIALENEREIIFKRRVEQFDPAGLCLFVLCGALASFGIAYTMFKNDVNLGFVGAIIGGVIAGLIYAMISSSVKEEVSIFPLE